MKIYICNLEKNNFFTSYTDFLPKLPEEDRARITRFVRSEDRARGTAGTLLIRRMVSEYLGHDDFKIERDEYGKPFLKGAEDFYFSLSHSGSYAVSACGSTPVGIDVEICAPHDIAKFRRIFREEDLKLLRSSSDRLRDFYRIWTVREAWSKMIGQGIALFDADFRVSYEDHTFAYEDGISSFVTYDLGGYLLSVCSENAGEVMEAYEVVPGDREADRRKVLLEIR